MLKTEVVTDYAMPLMKIERMAREIHDLCLARKYEKAREITLQLGVENRILQATLALMEEKEKQLHEIPQAHNRGMQEVRHQG